MTKKILLKSSIGLRYLNNYNNNFKCIDLIDNIFINKKKIKSIKIN